MLTLQKIREEKEEIIKGLKKRNLSVENTINQILKLDEERRSAQHELDSILNNIKTLSKEIGQLYAQGKGEEAEQKKTETQNNKETSKRMQEKMQNAESQIQALLIEIPNVPHEDVKAGKSAEENEIIKDQKDLPVLPEWAKPHWEIMENLDIMDMAAGTKITGAGFPLYKGKGAKLQRSLIQFFLDKATDAGYLEVIPPLLINEASAYATGQLPDKEGQMYEIQTEKFFLIPTAEVPITNLYRDALVDPKELPVKLVGYTPCFRREAGSYGKDVRGLNRVHQFDKVEIVQIQKPENSYKALKEMIDYVESLLTELNIPYRIVRLCGGDMGFTAAMTYDFEIYAAGQKRWLEVSSVSNFESFQSNRLKLRYKEEGKTKLLHTLNGSALALARLMAVIIENNQTQDGVNIPEVLKPYTKFDSIT
ncbi:MAG: serine--tRNA ligase [Chitinophagaceae bacterium]|nr:MAG: serine--tRNA ligase [Chitinophagaceae bacterium]